MLEKTFDAASVEPKIAKKWDEVDAFAAGAGAREGASPYCIVIPPPNVTGSLHMGHALNNTLQDVLIRYQRMKGNSVLWQPGMDHAGIATQMVVERQLAQDGANVSRREMGREKFVERVWRWKDESGGIIFNQLKRLGASCDWSRERFTMDDGLSSAVLEVFVRLHKEGLIYRDKRLVNWDPKLLTAISDLEVEQVETGGNLWHFRYPLADGASYEHPYNLDDEGNRIDWKPSVGAAAGYETRDYLVVATTRPETMLGDTGVAVHPEDPRYKDLIGKHVILPLVGRQIPIVADEYPDPEAGTGAVKMTPAHDFNDFEVGKRHNLAAVNVMTPDAHMTLKQNSAFLAGLTAHEDIWGELDGMDRFAARQRIVEMFEERSLLDRIEPHAHQVPHGDRGGVPIEPYLTDQWYVDAATLAGPAIASVREGRTQFVPRTWENTYFNWMENIQPWCISRQLWWGHQIPAWYGPDGAVFVERTEEEAAAAATAHYGEDVELKRDEDVLDTWFSSALWPFSTLGWPEKTPEMATWYPTNVLSTAFDIIFFWVARMMMMGLHFTGQEPFHTVYIHPLVRDKFGQKMSKSKNNGIDPLEVIDEYGADALRFTLAIMAAQGRDVKLDPARIAGYRNFGTKLWNATRFAQMNGVKHDPAFKAEDAKLQINRWILTEFSKAVGDISAGIDQYRFNDAAGAAYKFVWNTFCDWYLELLKPVFNGDDAEAKAEAQACAAAVLDGIYKLLHPFMPFMTEELWTLTYADRASLLCHAEWPMTEFTDSEAADEINWLVDLVTGIRSARAEMNVPASAKAPLIVVDANDVTRARLLRHDPAIKQLARVEDIIVDSEVPAGSAPIVVGEATACLPLGGLIDIAAETARLQKAIGKVEADIAKIEGKLANEKFVANAKPEVVDGERHKLSAALPERESLNAALARLGQIKK